MTLIDNYRHTHILLLDRSYNCTAGNTWIWNHVAQCLERVHHVLGFTSGLLSIVLCAAAYISISLTRSRDHGHRRHIRLSAVMIWLSEVTSLFGAILSLQLPTQILYSIVMVPVYTICCTYAFIKTSTQSNQKHYKAKSANRTFMTRCMYPIYMLFPAVMYVIYQHHPGGKITARTTQLFQDSLNDTQIGLSADRLLGYSLGISAGVLIGCMRVVDIIYVYSSFESSRCFPLVYLTQIAGSTCYTLSVSLQSSSSTFMFHSSPWTIPRLINIGVDFGILLQRVLQYRHTKQRRLSDEGTKSLISSCTDDDSSGSDSEEVIWMPLKIVETVQPQNASYIQVLTVSESSFDSGDGDKSVPEVTLIPGQSTLFYPDNEIEDVHRDCTRDCIRDGTETQENTVYNGDVNGTETGEDSNDDRNSEYGNIQHNDISETSTSSDDSQNTNARRPLSSVSTTNCINDSIASLGSVTTVEKIHSWISTSN